MLPIDSTTAAASGEPWAAPPAGALPLFHGSTIAQALLDPATERVVAVNEALLALWRTPIEQLVGRRVAQLNVAAGDTTTAPARPVRVSRRLLDGELQWLQLHASRAIVDGRPLLHVIAHDVSLQVRGDLLLQESHERFRTSFERAPMGLAQASPEGRTFELNDRLCEILGYSREELFARSFRDVTHPEDLAIEQPLFERLLRGELPAYTIEKRVTRRDGTHAWVELTRSAVRAADGSVRFLIAAVADIGERKRIEQRLWTSEEHFRQLTEAIQKEFWIASADGRESLYVSPSFERVWGRSPACLAAGRGALIDFVHPDDRAAVAARWTPARGEPWELQFRIVTPEGEVRWLHERGFPVLDARGAVLRLAGFAEDITARRNTELALERSLQLFRTLTEHSAEVIAIVRPDSCFTYLSPSAERVFGHAPADRLGHSCLADVHPDDVPCTSEAIAAALRAPGAPCALKVRYRHADGGWRVLEATLRSMLDHPVIGGILMNGRDVTAREAAVDALRVREAHYRLAFDSSPAPMWLFDAETLRFLMVNDAAVRQYGWTREEFLALTLNDIRPPEDLPALATWCAGLRDGGHNAGATRHRLKDGTLIDVEFATEPVTIDGRHARLALLRDVTERRRAERALGEANEWLTTLVQNSPLPVIAIGRDSRVTMWNAAAERLLGWAAAEIVGRELPTVPAGREAEHARIVRDVLVEGRETLNLETQRLRRDGSPVDVLLSVAPLRDATGQIASVVGFLVDITERKTLEAQFRMAQKMEAVGRLAGGVAHDFNNLLMAIRGYGDALSEDLASHDPRREHVEQILGASERAMVLTRQLLAFSRQQVLQPRVLDLNFVIRDVEKLLRRVIGEDIVFRTALDDTLGAVRADPGQVEQVLMNLVVNARDAMPEGGRIAIRTANVTLDRDAAPKRQFVVKPGPYALIEVRDTGCGMSPDVRARIFEPFFTTKETGHGTGLGLATVYGIVKQSDGYIMVDSTPDEGTTFRVYLPRIAEELPPAMPATRTPATALAAHGGTETILLVEDEHALRTLISRMLRRSGYTVLDAPDGATAIQLCQDHAGPIHLLVTDVVMPEMGGRALAERLVPLRPEMRVAYMSGYTEDEVVRRGLVDARIVLLQKPIPPNVLTRRIRELLDAPFAA